MTDMLTNYYGVDPRDIETIDPVAIWEDEG